MDEKDLKITALKQRIGEITSDYEDRIADLRVNITYQQQQLEQLQRQNQELESQLSDLDPAPDSTSDVLEGEVV